ncbi:hypothetical protein [Noviherbaspirillum saxi]|nr:hypothetical protein [Noviherbaspirillum saxi]
MSITTRRHSQHHQNMRGASEHVVAVADLVVKSKFLEVCDDYDEA